MFKTSHLQELKRRYASMYASPVEEEVIEDGTIEGANQYKRDTPGQGEEDEIEEGFQLQATMALDDEGIKSKWKKGKLYVAKRDIKKAEKALGKSFKRMKKGAEPDLYYEEVEIDEEVLAEVDYKYDGKVVKISKKNFSKVHKDYKNSTKGKERMLINDPKTNGTISVPVQFEEVEIDEANEFWAVIDKAKGGEVMAVSSDEKGAKSSVKMSNFSKHDYHFGKDPRTLKIVKVAGSYKKGEKMIGTKLSYKEEVEVDEAKGTAYPATIDTLRMIVKEKQHQTIMFKSGKAIVDLFTASAMVQVYDALKKPDMKKTFEKMITDKAGFMKTQAFAMKMVG